MVDTLCPSELFRLKPLGPYSIIHPIATLSTHCMVAVVVVILLIVIFVGVFVGYKLDSYFTNLKPLFTVSFSLISIAVALYSVLRKLIKK